MTPKRRLTSWCVLVSGVGNGRFGLSDINRVFVRVREGMGKKTARERTCFDDLGFRQMCVTQIAIDGGIRIQWVGNLSHFRGNDI